MIHVLRLLDKPGSAALRRRVRPAHKTCLGAMAGRIGEPFRRAGLYAGTEIHAFVNLWPQRAGFPEKP